MKTTSSKRRIPNLDEHNEAISLFFNISIRTTKKTILEFRTSERIQQRDSKYKIRYYKTGIWRKSRSQQKRRREPWRKV